MNILFVCTGNTCRSPLAEVIAKSMFPEHSFSSCGLLASRGAPASLSSVIVAESMGLDLSSHVARQLSPQILEEADLVLTMGIGHKMQIIDSFPLYAERVLTLGEFAGKNEEVADPYGGDMAVYKRAALQMEKMLALIKEENRLARRI